MIASVASSILDRLDLGVRLLAHKRKQTEIIIINLANSRKVKA